MLLADFLGKKDELFAAAHLSPAVASDPDRILLLRSAVGVLVVVFDFLLNYRYPVVAARFRNAIAQAFEPLQRSTSMRL